MSYAEVNIFPGMNISSQVGSVHKLCVFIAPLKYLLFILKASISCVFSRRRNEQIHLQTYMGQFPEDGGNVMKCHFFKKVELSCGQTVKDKFDFSIVLSQLYLLHHQNTSRWTS